MNSSITCESNKKNHSDEKLKETLKCMERELCEVRRQLCECQKECNQLNETNQLLKTNMKNHNSELANAISCAARAEERLKCERESFCDELRKKCEQLSNIQVRYDEQKRNAEDNKCKYDHLFKTLIEVNKLIGQDHYEVKNQVYKLQKEICMKEENLCNLKNEIKELKQKNELNIMEINDLKNKLHEKECQLKRMAITSDKFKEITQECNSCCNSKNKTAKQLLNDTCTKPKHCVKDTHCGPTKIIVCPKIRNKNTCNL